MKPEQIESVIKKIGESLTLYGADVTLRTTTEERGSCPFK